MVAHPIYDKKLVPLWDYFEDAPPSRYESIIKEVNAYTSEEEYHLLDKEAVKDIKNEAPQLKSEFKKFDEISFYYSSEEVKEQQIVIDENNPHPINFVTKDYFPYLWK